MEFWERHVSVVNKMVRNWAGTVHFQPQRLVRPKSEQEIVDLLANPSRCPSPVRAMGHYHSTTHCTEAVNGTTVDMSGMDRILEISDSHVTVQAGALYKPVALELARRGLNFYINLQIGPVTLGSLATCDTKDGSAQGEFGQFGAYATAMRLVTADGRVVDVNESDTQMLDAVRGSYGLLGIVTQVTFRITRLKPVAVEHITFSTTRFIEQLPKLLQRDVSMMVYIFPFSDRITVMLRSAGDADAPQRNWVWKLRNYGVAVGLAPVARVIGWLPFRWLRFVCLQLMQSIARVALEKLVHAKNTNPVYQGTDYVRRPHLSRFTFSIYAFPLHRYAQVLVAYKEFCEDYYRQHHYRPSLLNVGYHVAGTRYSWFSYSYDGPVMTIDPVDTGGPQWDKFCAAFNDFCHRYGGKPLFNQTPDLEHKHIRDVYDDRLEKFQQLREKLDPSDRFLNSYFSSLLYG